MQTYHVIGLMSGSSLDGADLALCRFDVERDKLIYWSMVDAVTIPYTASWIGRLKSLPHASARELVLADVELGHLFGSMISDFVQNQTLAIDLISSHGHTIFHFPEQQCTTQIGDGAAIAMETKIDTVTSLRSMDIAYGGQGAPIAPLGDRYLMPTTDYYLNLGGISNINIPGDGHTVAFDISGCNQILNALSQTVGKDYDLNGEMASKGKILPDLLSQLQQDPYLIKPYPKSLDNEYVRKFETQLALDHHGNIYDKLATVIEFIALELKNAIQKNPVMKLQPTILVTGGGTLNLFMIHRMKTLMPESEFIIPDRKIIEYKEAAFIALAGLRRKLLLPNIFADVTGASIDTINGAYYSRQFK